MTIPSTRGPASRSRTRQARRTRDSPWLYPGLTQVCGRAHTEATSRQAFAPAAGFPAWALTTVGRRRDTEAMALTKGGVMSDPVASLHDHADILSAALEQWTQHVTVQDKATARRAANTVVDAIDALLCDLYLLRGRLVQEIRQADNATRCQVT